MSGRLSKLAKPLFETWQWTFVIGCGLVGAAILISATSRYGMGVSSDSMYYISTADNFKAGNGFIDFGNKPLTDFPPLYPFILGIASGISGVTPFVWARYINATVMALLIASTGLMLLRAFPTRRLWFILGTLATLLFYPLYTLAANVSTDLMYILISLWFCLAAFFYLESENKPALALMILLAASGSMLRWVGLAFIVTLFLLVLYAQREHLRQAFWLAALSGGLAGLPLLLWEGARNIYFLGTSGRIGYAPDRIDELKNIALTIDRILRWATPYPLAFCIGLTLIFLAPMLLLSRLSDWKRFFHRLGGNAILPMLLLSLVYLVAVIASSWTGDHLDVRDDRYQVPLYSALLLVFFASTEELLLPHLARSYRTLALTTMIGVFCIWGGFQTAHIIQFIETTQERGVDVYNEYNNRQLIRSRLVVYLLNNPPSPQSTLYSNVPEAVYFFLHRSVKLAPWDPENYTAVPENLFKYYADWHPEEEAYLIFFKPNYKRHHYSPEDITAVAKLENLFKNWQGELFRILPKE